MPTPFDRAWQRGEAAIGRVMGEGVRIEPRIGGGLAGFAADGSRPSLIVTGVFALAGQTARLQGQRQGAELQGLTSLSTADATCWLGSDTVAALGYTLRKDDAIVLTSRAGAPRYAVAWVEPTDRGDATLHLTRELGL